MTHPKITSTKNVADQYIKILVHGGAGAGKTRLCATTTGKTLILSAEGGLRSLKGTDIDTWKISSMDDLTEAYTFLTTDKVYSWVCLDSISEIAEVCLAEEKKANKDGRKAYGEMQDKMLGIIRAFRDLEKNVYFSAKQDRIKDEVTGGLIYGCGAPGSKIGAALPYFFDFVFALHSWKDEEGKIQRAFQTQRDAQYEAKARGEDNELEFIETASLAHIYDKVTKTKQGE